MHILLIIGLLLPTMAHANVVGPAWQNFNTTTDGLDYVTVQSSKTLMPGILNLGFFANDAINTLPYLDSSTQSRVRLNDNLLGADFNAGIGLAPRWDAGISLPMMLYQHVNDSGDIHGEFLSYGLTEVRLNTKYRLLGDDEGGFATVGSVNLNTITDDPYSGHGGSPTYNLELVADKTINHFLFALNAGRRFRHSGSQISGIPIEPLSDQWIFSGAASYLVTSVDTKLIAEVFASTPVGSGSMNQTRSLTSAEALVGAKHDINTSLSVHAGGGTGLNHGMSSPDWRVYAGLNYTFGPLWKNAPAALVPVPQQDKNVERFRASNVTFKTNSDQLTGEFNKDLEGLAKYLHSVHFEKLIVEGHTDSVGNRDYNMDLSQRRAKRVRDYLVNQLGVDPKLVEIHGYGPDRPVANNGNFQGREQNRRVEFEIVRGSR
jgi:outer membrane protein OmpA-like peptidoglycan-associated protein